VRPLAVRLLEGNEEWSESLQRLQRGESLSETEWGRLKSIVEKEQPLIEAVKALARTPGYEMEAFPPRSGRTIYRIFPPSKSAGNYSVRRPFFLEKKGDTRERSIRSWMMSPGRAASRIEADYPSDRLLNIPLRDVATLGLQCDDPEILQGVLLRLEELDPLIHLNCLEDPAWLDAVAMLRGLKRRGVQVDLESRQPKIHFLRQWMELNSPSGKKCPRPTSPFCHDRSWKRFMPFRVRIPLRPKSARKQ
jgi:hypothetical protein